MARATVMASMSPVDLVMLFDEDTPLEMIQALRPDVLVKGSDYTVDQVVGGDLVQGWGGKVVLVDAARGPQHHRHDPPDDRAIGAAERPGSPSSTNRPAALEIS